MYGRKDIVRDFVMAAARRREHDDLVGQTGILLARLLDGELTTNASSPLDYMPGGPKINERIFEDDIEASDPDAAIKRRANEGRLRQTEGARAMPTLAGRSRDSSAFGVCAGVARRVVWIMLALAGIAMAAMFWFPPRIFGDPHIGEVRRLRSPSGAAEAVVQMIDGGATTSRAYCVFIVPTGAKSADDYRMVTYDRPMLTSGEYGLAIDWVSPTVLEVEATKAKQVFDKRSNIAIRDLTYRVQRKL